MRTDSLLVLKQKIRLIQILTGIILAFLLAGCQKSENKPGETRGEIVETSYLADYTPSFVLNLVHLAGAQVDLDIEYQVTALKMVYYTEGKGGSLVEASGVLLIPKGQSSLPLLSIQHGTETLRRKVASSNPATVGEGVVGMVAASLGFAVCLPDYLGLGVSETIHPYLLAKPSAAASLDLIRACTKYLEEKGLQWDGNLYLGGYSEGGYATLALLKDIEENYYDDFQVTACAPMAGPYDLDNTIRLILQQSFYPEPAFIGYFLTAYNDYYGWNRLNEIFKTPYAGEMENLFDGTHTTGEINDFLPDTISSWIQAAFINSYIAGTDAEMRQAVEENTLLDWVPKAPVRFYHSNGDEIVPYQNSLTAMRVFVTHDATDIQLVTIDSLPHAEAALPAYTGMIEWFDSLNTGK